MVICTCIRPFLIISSRIFKPCLSRWSKTYTLKTTNKSMKSLISVSKASKKNSNSRKLQRTLMYWGICKAHRFECTPNYVKQLRATAETILHLSRRLETTVLDCRKSDKSLYMISWNKRDRKGKVTNYHRGTLKAKKWSRHCHLYQQEWRRHSRTSWYICLMWKRLQRTYMVHYL